MLKSVRYGADRTCVRNVHWLHALAAPTIIVGFAPSSSSDAKSTAEDTDIGEPLLASGRLTLSADASDEQRSSAANRNGRGKDVGAYRTIVVGAASAWSQCTFRTQVRSAPY